MSHTTRSARRANETRRRDAASRQEPLPLAEQQRRAAARAAEHRERYPTPPKCDPNLDVRGDPSIKGQPVPIFRPRFRSSRLPSFPVLPSLAKFIRRIAG